MTQYNPNPNGTSSSAGAWIPADPGYFGETVKLSYTPDGLRVVKPAGKPGSFYTPYFSTPASFSAVFAGWKLRHNTPDSTTPTSINVYASNPASQGGGTSFNNGPSATHNHFFTPGTFVTFPNFRFVAKTGESVLKVAYHDVQILITLGAGAVDFTLTNARVYNALDSDIPASLTLDGGDNVPAFTYTPNSLSVDYAPDGAANEAVNTYVLDVPSEVDAQGKVLIGTVVKPDEHGRAITPGTLKLPRAGRFAVRATASFVGTSITDPSYASSYNVTVPTGAFSADFAWSANYLALAVDASSSIYPTLDPPSSYAWTWGDGTPGSTGQQQNHTFAAPGTYDVTLTMTSAATSRTATVTRTVTVLKAPDPANYFTAIRDLLSVTFTPSRTGAASYAWDFGDGTTDTVQAPVHAYQAPGTYTVTLTVAGLSPVSQTVTVRSELRRLKISDVLSLEVAVPWPAGTAYNRLPNPSGELGAWGWLTPVTGSYVSGSSSATGADDHNVSGPKLIFHSSGSGAQTFYSQAVGVVAGQYAAAQLALPYVDGAVRVAVEALSSAGAVIGTSTTTGYLTASDLVRTTPYLLPAGTVSARVRIDHYAATTGGTPAAGKIVQYRRAMLATAATSAALTANPYLEGVVWQNIIGPTSHIETSRPALNLGILSATIQDSSFDPATSGTLRPGQAVRLRVLAEDLAGAVAPDYLWSGTLLKATSSYNPRRRADDPKSTTVVLSATDATTPLTQTACPLGVATLSELPAVLEDAGVPYEINGGSGQVPAATVVAYNPNASVLDQIAITRDTTGSYAYVSRAGVLVAVDPQHMSSAPVGDVSEHAYSGIDAEFSTDKIINSVMFNWLRYTPAVNGQPASTTVVPYGPYEDQASIDEWGRFTTSKPFTIQGLSETDAAIQARANAILAANAQPVRTIAGATLPIRYVEDVTRARALLELYDPVRLRYDRTDTDTVARVTSVKHTITPRGWTMVLGFAPDGAVASPQLVSAPPALSRSSFSTTDKLGATAGASSAITAGTAATDVPGMSVTLNVTATSQRFLVTTVFDLSLLNGGLFTGRLVVDGVEQTAQAPYNTTATLRGVTTQSYIVTGLPIGSRTFKGRSVAANATAYTVNPTHSTITVTEI